jgi:hypothetical protein
MEFAKIVFAVAGVLGSTIPPAVLGLLFIAAFLKIPRQKASV